MPSPKGEQTWHRVFRFLEPAAVGIANSGYSRYITWKAYEEETGCHRNGSRAAYRRALDELEELYGVSVSAQDQGGFRLRKVEGR